MDQLRTYLLSYSQASVWVYCYTTHSYANSTCRVLSWKLKLEGPETVYADLLLEGLRAKVA